MPIWVDLLDSANQKYDNAASGLTASQVQAAIDELEGLIQPAGDLTDAVFPTYAVFDAEFVADATVNFSDGNKQSVDATTHTALTLTFPGIGNYVLKILNSGDLATITPPINWDSGTAPLWAGTSILSLYYDGTTLYGSAIVGAAI